MRDIKLCYPALQIAWTYTRDTWNKANTNKPQPIITCTLRTWEEQEALHAQGRLPLIEVNRLRKKAGLIAISQTEAKKIVTNAEPGQSKHNPDKTGMSRAFDIGFLNLSSGKNTSLNWNEKLFEEFAKILLDKYSDKIEWGGNWKKFKDFPHFEIRG